MGRVEFDYEVLAHGKEGTVSNPGYRTVNRVVEYDIELTGDPVVWTDFREGSRPVLVKSVRMRFGHGDDGFFMEANVQGPYLSSAGKPLKAHANDYTGPPDLWPVWLTALAEEHQPEGYATHSGPISLDAHP